MEWPPAGRPFCELLRVLLALPYEPVRAEGLILADRRILAEQMAFLRERVGRGSRLKAAWSGGGDHGVPAVRREGL